MELQGFGFENSKFKWSETARNANKCFIFYTFQLYINIYIYINIYKYILYISKTTETNCTLLNGDIMTELIKDII